MFTTMCDRSQPPHETAGCRAEILVHGSAGPIMAALPRTTTFVIVALCAWAIGAAGSAHAATISGQVYDPATGQPARGIALRLIYDAEDATSPGAPVLDSDVGPGQQGQITGSEGAYRFDVLAGRRYQLIVDTERAPFAAPSVQAPAQSGFAPLGPVVPQDTAGDPSLTDARIYYLRFDISGQTDEVRNNHIPVDALPDVVALGKRADRLKANIGDIVQYTVTATNRSGRDLTRDVGRAVFILDIPPRGFAYLRGRAVARIERGSVVTMLPAGSGANRFGDEFENQSSRRIVRFGPFDLPAGARLTLSYPMVVNSESKPGLYDNRAVLVDAGGVELSAPGRARVRIAADTLFEAGTLLGRVYCARDGRVSDRATGGRAGPDSGRDAGVMGARVYLDMGSYAVTDAAGFYHFSRIPAGTHLAKVDVNTLAGGRSISSASRLVQLSAGLVERADFAVHCRRERVRFIAGTPRSAHTHRLSSTEPEAEKPVEAADRNAADGPTSRVVAIDISGGLEPLEVRASGQRVALPLALLTLNVPPALRATGQRNLPAVPPKGYGADQPTWHMGWNAPGDIAPRRWTLRIDRANKDGSLSPVRRFSGAGALPPAIAWDGLDDAGAPLPGGQLYAAQLVVIGSARGAEAASARKPFGIAQGSSPAGPTETIWRGQLFRASRGKLAPSPALKSKVVKLAKTLGPGDRVTIECHSDGTGDRMKSLVDTKREAELIAALLVGAGAAAERIAARGRGTLDTLQRGPSEAARQQNRRVVVRVVRSRPVAVPVPQTVARQGDVLVAGTSVPLDGKRFSHRATGAPGQPIVIDVQSADGRRAAIEIALPETLAERSAPSGEKRGANGDGRSGRDGPADRADHRAKTIEVRGDLDTSTLTVGDDTARLRILATDARIVRAGQSAHEPDFETVTRGAGRALKTAIEFELSPPPGLSIASWRLSVSDRAGREIWSRPGQATVTTAQAWSGKDASGALLLASGQRYSYRLRIVTRTGQIGISPERYFTVDSAASRRLEMRGALFDQRGQLGAEFAGKLTDFAKRAQAGDPTGSCDIQLRIAAMPQASASDVRLTLAARSVVLRRQLRAAGLPGERFALQVSMGDQAEDHLIAVVPPRPPPPARDRSRVVIDGTPVALSGTAFRTPVITRADRVIAIDLTNRAGHRAILSAHVSAAPARAAEPAPGPQHDPKIRPDNDPSASAFRSGAELAGDAAWIEETSVWLPLAGTVLGSSDIAIRGVTRPDNRVLVSAIRPASAALQNAAGDQTVSVALGDITVGSDGRFAEMITLPDDAAAVVVEVRDRQGRRTFVRRAISIAEGGTFFMALGEFIAYSAQVDRGLSREAAYLDGMTGDTTIPTDSMLFHIHGKLYLKSRFSGGFVADHIDLTAYLNTAEPAGSGDARHDFFSYGDASQEVGDVNVRGPLYVEAKAGAASAVLGYVNSDLEVGSLFRYQRTASGALLTFDKGWGSATRPRSEPAPHDGPGGRGDDPDQAKYRIQARAFAGGELERLIRDVNWYRATGGSVYYLRHGRVSSGSDKVRVAVRDSHNGLVLAERVLESGRDYTIDYVEGRIVLARPLASTASSDWLSGDFSASSAPLDGNPVYLEVSYEYLDLDRSDQAGDDRQGAFARVSLGPFSFGAGAVSETRPGGDDYSLWGVDARLEAGRRSALAVELAGSRQRHADNVLSIDGGLTFSDVNGIAPPASDEDTQLAWKVSGDLHGGDFTDDGFTSRAHLRFALQKLDRGFSSSGTMLDQGRLKLGAQLAYSLSERSAVHLRHDFEIAELPRVGPTRADIAANPDPLAMDERSQHQTTLQWILERGRFRHQVAGSHGYYHSNARLASGAPALDSQRLGVGASSTFVASERLLLRAGQRITVGFGDADPQLSPIATSRDALPDSSHRQDEPLSGLATTLGAEFRLAEDVSLGADWQQGWNGDNTGQIGLRSALSPTGSMYVSERLVSRNGVVTATSVVGAEDRINGTDGGRTYGEYQVERGTAEQRSRAVLGLAHRWQLSPGVRIQAGFEHQQVVGGFLPDGTPVGDSQRDVLHAGFALEVPDRVQASSHLELRVDNGDDGGFVEDIAVQDARPTSAAGVFADHGDAVLGASPVAPPGERWQAAARLGLTWILTPSHKLLSRLFAVHSVGNRAGRSLPAAYSLQATAGFSYRPVQRDWLNFLARYSYLAALRPNQDYGLGSDLRIDSRSHIAALVPLVDLPGRLALTGKLAWKKTRVELRTPTLDPATISGTGFDRDADVDSILWLVRLGYQFFGHWDASVELRGLHLSRPAGSNTARESRFGTAVELGYTIERRLRLGLGYNLSRISDNEFGDLERDAGGWFFRLTAQY